MTQSEVQTLRQEIRDLSDSFRMYVQADEEWKVRAEPVIKAFENTSWLLKILIAFLKVVGLLIPVGGAIMGIKKFLL